MCLVWLGQHRSLTKLLRGKREVKLPRSWGGFFRNDYDHRDFTAIGAAAGEELISCRRRVSCLGKDSFDIDACSYLTLFWTMEYFFNCRSAHERVLLASVVLAPNIEDLHAC